MLTVVVLNGGRGAASLIPALLDAEGLNVVSVVNAYDDGKSTGEIRRFFTMLGPSDIRKVQQLMVPGECAAIAVPLFEYRFPIGCEREEALSALRSFCDGAADVAGLSTEGFAGAPHLRRFLSTFLATLDILERSSAREFSFSDCSLMNCIYAGAFIECGRDLEQATRLIDRIFRLRGTVLPSSNQNRWLSAVRENNEVLYSEAEIVELRSNVRVKEIFLTEGAAPRDELARLPVEEQRQYLAWHHATPAASPGVVLALEQADIIIYSAGTQHSSLYPTYISKGVSETIANNREAVKVFVTNIGADYETPSYTTADYVNGAYRYLSLGAASSLAIGDLFSVILVNNGRRKADETYVEHDTDALGALDVPIVMADLESDAAPGKHDGQKLVAAILATYEQMRLK